MTSKLKTALVILFSLFLVVSISFAISSSKKNEIVNTQFRYIGTTADYEDLIEESNWEISTGSEQCPVGEALPCLVAPEMNLITTPSELVNHLTDYTNDEDAVDFILENTKDWRD